MSVTVKNQLTTLLDVPGAGLIFQPGEEKTVGKITLPLSRAIQGGQLVVTNQESEGVIEVEEEGADTFSLPFPWPGPDVVQLSVGGVVQIFGSDWTVEPSTNSLHWLNENLPLHPGDQLIFIGSKS